MPTTFTIPLTTLPVGTRVFGPANAADAEGSITLTIDRAVAGGLNSLTAASTLNVDVQQSGDGGATWQDLGGWGTGGGSFLIKGVPVDISAGTWHLIPGTSRRLQAVVTAAGTPVVVAGSIVTQ